MATDSITGKFEGYLWESDKQEPQIYIGDNLLTNKTFNSDENPFCIEGLLFDKTTGHSVSIKYVDGEYKIKKYSFKTDADGNIHFYVFKENEKKECVWQEVTCEVKERYYKGSSKLKGLNLHFYELWEEEGDKNCCDMKVLKATKVIFAGFDGQDDKTLNK